ncbi:hypothetical protein JZK55_17990 [Dissulfurispira thermophila]|uniref:Uncharacterized protein n=2 Tax=root TaxID=1 RepID=A0A7G1H581_9BACT|nr:hypothetical protein [Dissulfurispira thermophila]BCB96877.1 hypothetical protein JZK55_17990 [Dissulfurispira thermophila]
MCKIIRKILCIIIIALVLFIGITIWGKGGDKLRWIGEKTSEIIKKGADELGKKADNLKEKTETTKEKVKKWTGKEGDKEDR